MGDQTQTQTSQDSTQGTQGTQTPPQTQGTQTPPQGTQETQGQGQTNFGDLTNHPDFKSWELKLKQEVFSAAKGRLLKEFGVKSEQELKDKISSLEQGINPTDDFNFDPTPPANQGQGNQGNQGNQGQGNLPPEVAAEIKKLVSQTKSLQTQLSKEKEARLQERTNFESRQISDAIQKNYLTLGGLPDTGDSKFSEQVRIILTNQYNFQLEDNGNVITNEGIPLSDVIKGFLDKYPNYRTKGNGTPPPSPGTPPPTTSQTAPSLSQKYKQIISG